VRRVLPVKQYKNPKWDFYPNTKWDFYPRFSPGTLVSSCSNTGSIRDDPYWTSRKNSLELIEISSINKVGLV
jgi:hypothetical protein